MAIEIPNAIEAGGLFNGSSSPPAGGPIISSNGFLAYDPATNSGTPVGGFTRLQSGAYLLQLERPIDGGEGGPFVQKFQGPTLPNAAVPSANITEDGFVGVVDSLGSLDEGGTDFNFYLHILRWQYGPNLTPNI